MTCEEDDVLAEVGEKDPEWIRDAWNSISEFARWVAGELDDETGEWRTPSS